MKRIILILSLFLGLTFNAYAINSADIEKSDIDKIEKLTGQKGQFDPKEKVFKISSPRKDLKVTINNEVNLIPEMGLTSWTTFKKVGSDVMIMGDLVLTENQVNPVMSLILAQDLKITALHNHFFWETPRIMFMHVEGMGRLNNIAQSVGKIYSMINSPDSMKSTIPQVNINPAETKIDSSKIDSIIGVKGTLKNGVYKIVIGRTAQMDGITIGNTMGVNTWAAFTGTDNQAVVDGDIAMHESELQDVLRALRKAEINVVAIHQHMIEEKPRFIFLHYYGIGTTKALAKGIRAALDVTNCNKK